MSSTKSLNDFDTFTDVFEHLVKTQYLYKTASAAKTAHHNATKAHDRDSATKEETRELLKYAVRKKHEEREKAFDAYTADIKVLHRKFLEVMPTSGGTGGGPSTESPKKDQKELVVENLSNQQTDALARLAAQVESLTSENIELRSQLKEQNEMLKHLNQKMGILFLYTRLGINGEDPTTAHDIERETGPPAAEPVQADPDEHIPA